jgi:hypothetical protein
VLLLPLMCRVSGLGFRGRTGCLRFVKLQRGKEVVNFFVEDFALSVGLKVGDSFLPGLALG